jgi:hypothetical protein
MENTEKTTGKNTNKGSESLESIVSKKPRILVMESGASAEKCFMYQTMLEGIGVNADVVLENERQNGLKRIDEEYFDAVVLDLYQPTKDEGLSTIKKIRDRYGKRCSIITVLEKMNENEGADADPINAGSDKISYRSGSDYTTLFGFIKEELEKLEKRCPLPKKRMLNTLTDIIFSSQRALVADIQLDHLVHAERSRRQAEGLISEREVLEPYVYAEMLAKVIDQLPSYTSEITKDPSKYFFIENPAGKKGYIEAKCESIQKLAESLESMSQEQFMNYVNKDHNDIAKWISGVFEKDDLPKKLVLTTDKEETIKLLYGVPLLIAVDDGDEKIRAISESYGIKKISSWDAATLMSGGKLDHYSIFLVSDDEYQRMRSYRKILKTGMSYREAFIDLNKGEPQKEVKDAKDKPSSSAQEARNAATELRAAAAKYLEDADKQKLGRVSNALFAIAELLEGKPSSLIKHERRTHHIYEGVCGGDSSEEGKGIFLKISDRISAELYRERDVIKHYKAAGLNVPEIILVGNFADGRTYSAMDKINGMLLDTKLRLLDERANKGGEDADKARKIKTALLDEYIGQVVALHQNIPEQTLLTQVHSKKESENRIRYLQEVQQKFLSGVNIGMEIGAIEKDEQFLSKLKKAFGVEKTIWPYHETSTVYEPILNILSKAKVGLYTDRSFFNAIISPKNKISKEDELLSDEFNFYLIDFESVRNSPYVEDLATAFEMTDMLSGPLGQEITSTTDALTEIKNDLYFGGSVVYRKGDTISEKDRCLLNYATLFNQRQDSGKDTIKDFNEFTRQYHAFAVKKSLLNEAYFFRLIAHEKDSQEHLLRDPKNMKYASVCLDNAVKNAVRLKGDYADPSSKIKLDDFIELIGGVKDRIRL